MVHRLDQRDQTLHTRYEATNDLTLPGSFLFANFCLLVLVTERRIKLTQQNAACNFAE
jgi:hypothetical protein